MKPRFSAILSALILLIMGTASAFSQSGLRTWKSERKTWIDDSTGFEITKWTETGRNWHLYFDVESFIDETHAFVISERTGKANLFVLDLETGELTQVTDETDLQDSFWHLPKFATLWYFNADTLKAFDTRTYQTRVVCAFDSLRPESFSVTCDGRFVVFSANKHPGFTSNHSTGPYALFTLDLASKQVRQISQDLGFMVEHVQANPTDPRLFSYCWQHRFVEGSSGVVGDAPIRIWWMTIDGSDGGPVLQEYRIHRTHEFWFPDGSRLGYSARYRSGANKGKQYLGTSTVDGREHTMMPAPVLYAHSQMFKDLVHWVADYYDGSYLVLFTIGNDRIEKVQKLFRHDSSWKGQPSHPHPHFSPDGAYVLFSTDKTGTPEVYTVKIGLNK